jgi:cell division protein FtsQ
MSKDRGNPTEYGAGGFPGDGNPPDGRPFGEPYPVSGVMPMPEKRPGKAVVRLVVFLVIVSAALIITQSVVFRLKTVYVIGNKSVSAEHIAALSGLARGENIFAVTEDEVRDAMQEDHWIILNHLVKKYPNEIYLFVDEREIVASMQYLGIEYTLDINGMVMEEYSDMNYAGNVPTVTGFSISNAAVGEYLSVRSDAQMIAYSSIVSELTIQRYANHIVSINVSDPEYISMLTTDGMTVQLGNSDYMRAKIGAMRTDIAYLQQLGKTSGFLDVTVPEDGKFRQE